MEDLTRAEITCATTEHPELMPIILEISLSTYIALVGLMVPWDGSVPILARVFFLLIRRLLGVLLHTLFAVGARVESALSRMSNVSLH